MSETVVVQPRGAGILEEPELLLRQVLMEGLIELAGTPDQVEELFRRSDDLRQGSQDDWGDDYRRGLEVLVREGGIRVHIGIPMTEAVFPAVSIVTASSSEDAGGATLGGVLGVGWRSFGTPAVDPNLFVVERHTTIGGDWNSSLQVGCWATTPEESVLVKATVAYLLFRHKGRLTTAGIRDLSMSESGFTPDPQMYPRVGYVPAFNVSIEWTRRQTRVRRPVPTRITIRSTFRN